MDRWLNKVHCGDALELLKQMPDNSIDMVFTDPPYGHTENGSLAQRHEAACGWSDGPGQYREGAYKPIIINDGPEANELFRAVLPELRRVMKPGSCFCCCCCGGGGPAPQFARWSLWIDENLDFKQMVVWDKGPMGMGWHYRRSYETVLVAQKPGAACFWFDESSKVENIIRPGYLHIKKIIPTNGDHPTPKPVELAGHFIRLHTKPGMVVLDCFSGGGSTLVAAHRLGRRWIGIELSPEYCAMAKARIKRETAQQRIFL
jgi:site-specific DNA-methyltransferase (adenine-specific)